MDWRLRARGARCHSPGLAALARVTCHTAPCALSPVKQTVHLITTICISSCLAPIRRTEAGGCRSRARRIAVAAASANGAGGSGPPDAAAVASVPLSGSASDPFRGPGFAPSEGSLAAVLEACDGPRTTEQQKLLELEAQLACGALPKLSSHLAGGFSTLAQFDPRSFSPDPHVTHAAEAAKRRLLHSLATEAMTVVPKLKNLDRLMAILSACATTGYGWGSMDAAGGKGRGKGASKGSGAAAGERARAESDAAGGKGKGKGGGKGKGKRKGAGKGNGAEAEAGVEAGVQSGPGEEAEVPLAEAAMQRINVLAGTLSKMRKATRSSEGSVDPYQHARLWELMAACPPSAQPWCIELMSASAEALIWSRKDGSAGGIWPYRILLAVSLLQPRAQPPPVQQGLKLTDTFRWATFMNMLTACGQRAGSLDNRQLSHTVAALGKLLLAHEAGVGRSTGKQQQRRAALSSVALPVLETIQHVLLRLPSQYVGGTDKAQHGGKEKQQAAGLAKLLKAQTQIKREQKKGAKSFDGREACQLLQGLTMISEAFGRYANDIVNNGGKDTGGSLQEAQFVAAHAIAATELVASHVHSGGLMKLTPQQLSSVAVTLARTGYGRNDSYRALGAAATSAQGRFRESATPADWAQLWHALALVRHRPDDELVRCTAAALTKQQQYGSATAEDCSTLLLSLAELRCYDGGLVEVLLGRLVQLVAGGGGVEARDLTNAVWAVAVMGPEALQSHCGVVGQLLREVVVSWEQGRVGVGRQEQLWQLWQVQLELEGLVDMVAGRSGDSSSNSSPGQLRGILPPDLLQATEEAAGENPGGAHSSVRRDEVCSVLQGMVQQGGEQQEGQGARGQQRAGPEQEAQGSGAGSHTASEEGGAVADVATGAVPACNILSVTPGAAVPELRCTADVVVELGGGRRVAVEVEGPGRLLTNHPHTETRTGPAELRRRQLERVLGSGNVVVVSYWAWEELGGDRGRQEAWLGGRLAEGPGAGGEIYGGEAKGW